MTRWRWTTGAGPGPRCDGLLVKFPPGMLREILKSAPAEFTQHARNPANSVQIGGKNVVFAPGLWQPLRDGPRPGPPLRHAGGFPQLHQAGAVQPELSPLGRHDLRADRCAGEQAASGHGAGAYRRCRTGPSWGRSRPRSGPKTASRWPHPVRRGVCERTLRDPGQCERQFAAGLGRHDDPQSCAPMRGPIRRR